MTATQTEREVQVPKVQKVRTSRVLFTAGLLALIVGFGAITGGAVGAWYTWDQAAAQAIVTPDDAFFPEADVRGPFTMWAQADIITQHQLESTDGLYYSEMERVVPQVDENGAAVLDESGEPVMVPNEARASWINATALTTALSMGVMAYALAAFAVVIGITLVVVGYTFLHIRKRAILL